MNNKKERLFKRSFFNIQQERGGGLDNCAYSDAYSQEYSSYYQKF